MVFKMIYHAILFNFPFKEKIQEGKGTDHQL